MEIIILGSVRGLPLIIGAVAVVVVLLGRKNRSAPRDQPHEDPNRLK
ncbi:MAG: hypothetical protein HYX68_07290 [Planctomycetes bacterium]|nr:hypothetical protein [Planctomycetota bacterium]